MESRFSHISIPELPEDSRHELMTLRRGPSGNSLSRRSPSPNLSVLCTNGKISTPSYKKQDGKGNSHSSNMCITLFVALLALVVGTGGLGLALYSFFTGSSDAECACGSYSNNSSQLEYQLGQSQAEVEALQEIVSQRCQNVTSNSTAAMVCNATRLDRLESQVDDILTVLAELAESCMEDANTTTLPTTPPTTPVPQSVTQPPAAAQLQDLTLYENCTNIQLTQCAVGTSIFHSPPSFGVCSTMPVPIRVDGYYNIAMYCAITNPRTEQNPIITTLNVDESNNQMRCFCYVEVNSDDFPRAVIECALFATRCPITYHLETH